MGVQYTSVQWNRQKKFYDFTLVGGVAAFLVVFAMLTKILFPFITDEILIIRTFGAAAFFLLHVILCIGPLCRLNPKFLPLLYNRRHAGVTMFLLALIHAVLVVATYHAGSDTNPILSIFVSSPLTGSVAGVPFQPSQRPPVRRRRPTASWRPVSPRRSIRRRHRAVHPSKR